MPIPREDTIGMLWNQNRTVLRVVVVMSMSDYQVFHVFTIEVSRSLSALKNGMQNC